MCNPNLCPNIKAPFDDCYLSNMDSAKVFGAVYFCGGHYRECEIYKRHAESEKLEGNAPNRAQGSLNHISS